MTEAILIGVGILAFAAFVVGFVLGRKSITTTGSPTDASAAVQVSNAVAEDVAAQQALDDAKTNAQGVMNESDDDVAARVAQLRSRGRAGS